MPSKAKAFLEILKAREEEARERERAAKYREDELARLRMEAALTEPEVSDAATVKEREAEKAQRELRAQDRRIAQLELDIFELEAGRSLDFCRYHASFDTGYRPSGSSRLGPLRTPTHSTPWSPAFPPLGTPAYSAPWTPAYAPLGSSAYSPFSSTTPLSPRATSYPAAADHKSYSPLHGSGLPRSSPYTQAEGDHTRLRHSSFVSAQHFDYPDSVRSMSSDQTSNHWREVPWDRRLPTRSTPYGPYQTNPSDHDSGLPPTRSTPYGPYRPEPYSRTRATPYGPYQPETHASHDPYSGAPRTPPRRRVRFH
jgi:hypothetical protein